MKKSTKKVKLAALLTLSCLVMQSISTSVYAEASINDSSAQPKTHHLPANSDHVRWGNIGMGEPVLSVNTGDIITVEAVTHHSGDDYDRMIKGDAGVEDIFQWTKERKNESDRAPGVHILTGPIEVKGAEPGDVLEVRILDMNLRPSGNPDYEGKTYGSNAAANWGYLNGDMLEDPKTREVITIYEMESDGTTDYAKAAYSYTWTPQTDPDGKVHNTIDYPGVIVDHDTIVKKQDVLKDVRIPVRLHFGTMGVAPKEADVVDSVPPSYFGGNIDDWRIGEGSTMYYPVSVPGALLSVGDPHAAQGDSEMNGTAIETSLTGDIQVILHKKKNLDAKLADLSFPLLETEKEWVLHGFSYANYLAELGADAQKAIYKNSSIDKAMKDAAYKSRRFLMDGMGLTEDEAYSLMSVAVDYGITQVVDGNWGVHASIDRTMFSEKATRLITLRDRFESFGAKVKWNNTEQAITITYRNNTLVLKIGSNEASFNDKKVKLHSPIQLVEGSVKGTEYFAKIFQAKLMTDK
ncbi:acetamidase/formamidase family protein [Paenibacillus mendelii]|uniref:Acetamidase/formamidase family protein n=1 Tax=Paenibacillus mendelii TaxID=206163 RepID=A0ABV6J4G7_9BACL|nr:acetamidase/formamidase family protein [Paenibacillus mendelii]MCQ6561699.1 acetamidase/formamidase family protein [Paenibacillus mendelii]